MNICRKCAHYMLSRCGDTTCRLNGMLVGALWQRECFTEKEQEVMEEIKTTKVCKDCGRELTLSEFSHHPKSKDGVNGICKECMTKKQKGRVLSPRKGKSVKELADEASRPTPLEEMTTKLIIDMAKDTRLSSFTDAELMNELKLRGYSGTITKQFTI